MRVEPLVRQAFSAAVNRDPGNSQQALQTIADRGDVDARGALSLALAVNVVALYDIHDGARPTDEQLRELAASFTDMEGWADIDQTTALTFLTAVANKRSPEETLPADVVTRAVFVIGAWLLAAFLQEGEHWYSYLDETLNKVEAAPAQQ